AQADQVAFEVVSRRHGSLPLEGGALSYGKVPSDVSPGPTHGSPVAPRRGGFRSNRPPRRRIPRPNPVSPAAVSVLDSGHDAVGRGDAGAGHRDVRACAAGAGSPFRRDLLRGDHFDEDLLPPDLPCPCLAPRAPAVLPHGGGGRAGGISSVPTLPPGAGPGAIAGVRAPPARGSREPPNRRRRAERSQREGTGRRVVRERPAPPARAPRGVRREPRRAGADAQAAARQ